ITYEDVELDTLAEVTARIFASLPSFAVRASVAAPADPTFVAGDGRRRPPVLQAVSSAAPQWTDAQQATLAALLDVLWNLPSYERLVGAWGLPPNEATDAIPWLMAKLRSEERRVG